MESATRYFAAGQYRESIAALKAAYAAAPRPKLYYNIAVCYVKLNEPFEAITYLRLFQSEATNLSASQQSALTDQINEQRKQLNRTTPAAAARGTSEPKPRPPVAVDPKQAPAAAARPAPKEALASEAAVEKESADRYDAARVLYSAGRYQDAIVELKASYALSPRPKLYFNVAMCYMKLNQSFEAIAYFQRYLGEAPEVTAEKTREINGYVTQLRERLHPTPTPAPALAPVAGPGVRASTARDSRAEPPVPLYKRGWFWAVTIGAVVVVATAIAVPLVVVTRKNSLCDGVDTCIQPTMALRFR